MRKSFEGWVGNHLSGAVFFARGLPPPDLSPIGWPGSMLAGALVEGGRCFSFRGDDVPLARHFSDFSGQKVRITIETVESEP